MEEAIHINNTNSSGVLQPSPHSIPDHPLGGMNNAPLTIAESSSPWEPATHLVFVNAFEECGSIAGFQQSINISHWIALHGILGGGSPDPCVSAIQGWETLEQVNGTGYNLTEFTYHSHGDKFMGIGLVEVMADFQGKGSVNSTELIRLAEEVGSTSRYHGRR